jgi:hypothetical protein
MAFEREGLGRNGSGQGNAKATWSYSTLDAYATVVGANYFNDAQKELGRGDSILVWDDNLGVMTQTYVATSNDATGVVTIATGDVVTA